MSMDYDAINQKKFNALKNYYQTRGYKKKFGLSDENFAYSQYANKYNVPKVSLLSDAQKLSAIQEYSQENASFLQGANNYSEFIFNSNLADDISPESIEQIEESSSKFKDVLQEVVEFTALGGFLYKENRQELMNSYKEVDDATKNGLERGVLKVLNTAAHIVKQVAVGDAMEENFTIGLMRGAGQIVNSSGGALVEFYERKNFRAQERVRLVEQDPEVSILIDELRDLENRHALSLRGKGPALSDEERDRMAELRTTKVTDFTSFSDNSLSSVLTNYEKDLKFLEKEKYHIKALGESLKLIGSTFVEQEMLNNEWTKAVRDGEISATFKDPMFWLNQIPESIGQVIGLMALMAATPGEFASEAAAAQYIFEGLPINIMYSASEANQVREDARKQGFSEQEIDKMASDTFRLNVGVQGALGAAPGAWTKMLSKSKALSAFANSGTTQRITSKIAAVGVDAFFEGFEEILQDEIRNSQLNDDYKFLSEASAETFILGFAGGLFGGAGTLVQETAHIRHFNNMSEHKVLGPMVKQFKQDNMNQGMSATEAEVKALEQMRELMQGTPVEQEMNEDEEAEVKKALAEKITEGPKKIQEEMPKIEEKIMQQSKIEERMSNIEGTKFSRNEANPEIRQIQGVDNQAEYTSEYAIKDMIMRQSYKDFDIDYDEKTNTYSKKGKMSKWAKYVNEKYQTYQKAYDMLTNTDNKFSLNDVKKYLDKHGINAKDINAMYDNNVFDDNEYIDIVRKLGIKPTESKIADNIKLADDINSAVNDIDNLTPKTYKSLLDRLKSQFGTIGKGIDSLVKMGAINKSDANTFVKQLDVFKKQAEEQKKQAAEEAKDTTKKELDTTKKKLDKTVEENKKLKEEKKELKNQVKEEKLPQKVTKVEDFKQDSEKGKTDSEKKLDKIREPKKIEDKQQKITDKEKANINVLKMQEDIAIAKSAGLNSEQIKARQEAKDKLENAKDSSKGKEQLISLYQRIIDKNQQEIDNINKRTLEDYPPHINTEEKLQDIKDRITKSYQKVIDENQAKIDAIKNGKQDIVEDTAQDEKQDIVEDTAQEVDEYSDLTVKELKALAKKLGITGYSKMKRNELIKTVKENAIEVERDITNITINGYEAYEFKGGSIFAPYKDNKKTTAFVSINTGNGTNVIFAIDKNGKWKPVLGINASIGGKISILSTEESQNYYNSSELKAIGEQLDSQYGDIRGEVEKLAESENLSEITLSPSDHEAIMDNYEQALDKLSKDQVILKNLLTMQNAINELKKSNEIITTSAPVETSVAVETSVENKLELNNLSNKEIVEQHLEFVNDEYNGNVFTLKNIDEKINKISLKELDLILSNINDGKQFPVKIDNENYVAVIHLDEGLKGGKTVSILIRSEAEALEIFNGSKQEYYKNLNRKYTQNNLSIISRAENGKIENFVEKAKNKLHPLYFEPSTPYSTMIKKIDEAVKSIEYQISLAQDSIDSLPAEYRDNPETLKAIGYPKEQIKLLNKQADVYKQQKQKIMNKKEVKKTPINASPKAKLYNVSIKQAIKNHKYKLAVDVYEAQEYDEMTMILMERGKAGAAVKQDGNIVSVFKDPSLKNKKTIPYIINKAIKLGGIKLDAYNINGFLPQLYAKFGFVTVGKTKFDAEYAPEGWTEEVYGNPDVVAMVHKSVIDKTNLEIKEFDSYQEMLDYRDSLIVKEIIKEDTEAPAPEPTVGRKNQQVKDSVNVPTSLVKKLMDIDRIESYAATNDDNGLKRTVELAKSIAKEGVKSPLIINYNNITGEAILGEGNHRLKIAMELGLYDLPVKVVIGYGTNIAHKSLKLQPGLFGEGSQRNQIYFTNNELSNFINSLEQTKKTSELTTYTNDKQAQKIFNDKYSDLVDGFVTNINESIDHIVIDEIQNHINYEKYRESDTRKDLTSNGDIDNFYDFTSHLKSEKQYELRTDFKGQYYLVRNNDNAIFDVIKNDNGELDFKLSYAQSENDTTTKPLAKYAKDLATKYKDDVISDKEWEQDLLDAAVLNMMEEEDGLTKEVKSEAYKKDLESIKELQSKINNNDLTLDEKYDYILNAKELFEKYSPGIEALYNEIKDGINAAAKYLNSVKSLTEAEKRKIYEKYEKTINEIKKLRIENPIKPKKSNKLNTMKKALKEKGLNYDTSAVMILESKENPYTEGIIGEGMYLYDFDSVELRKTQPSKKVVYDLKDAKFMKVNSKESLEIIKSANKLQYEISDLADNYSAAHMFSDPFANKRYKDPEVIKSIAEKIQKNNLANIEYAYDVDSFADYLTDLEMKYVLKASRTAEMDVNLEFDIELLGFEETANFINQAERRLNEIIAFNKEIDYDKAYKKLKDAFIGKLQYQEDALAGLGFDGIDFSSLPEGLYDDKMASKLIFSTEARANAKMAEIQKTIQSINKKLENSKKKIQKALC